MAEHKKINEGVLKPQSDQIELSSVELHHISILWLKCIKVECDIRANLHFH